MGCDDERAGGHQDAVPSEGGGVREVPAWLTGNVLAWQLRDQRTIELVRAAHEFGDRLEVQTFCSLVEALAERDVAIVQTIEDIQTWLREVVRHPEVRYRLALARALSGHPVGNPIMEIAGELCMVLVDDDDVEVRRAVARFIMFVGNDESRDQHPEFRDWVEPGEVYGIVGRLVSRGSETVDDCGTLVHIVTGSARTLRSHGVADLLIMKVVESMLDGTVDGELACAHALLGTLDQCAEALEVETLSTLVALVERNPDDEVQETWLEMAEILPAQRAALEERVAAYRRRASGEYGVAADVSAEGLIELTADPPEIGSAVIPAEHAGRDSIADVGAIEPGQDLRGSCLRGADLAGRKLVGCDFTGVDLSGADLRGANLSGAVLYRAVLVGAQLDRADLSNAILSGADLAHASLFAADVVAASCIGTNLRGANLTAARFRGANLEDADLRGALIDSLDVYCARIIGATFDGPGPEGCL